MLILFILAALLYSAASVFYGIERSGDGDERARRIARVVLALAGLLHFAWIGAQSASGAHPFESVSRVVSFGAVLTVGVFFLIARGRSLAALGAIIAPIGLVGLAMAAIFDIPGVERMPASPGLTRLHIGLATAGLAGFILAAGVAAVYLAMERRLRARQFKPRPGAISLAGLDRIHHRVMLVVTPLFTLAMVTGVLWIARAGGLEDLRDRWFELVLGGVGWLACVAVLGLRAALGMRGRRAAVLTLLAFVCTVAIFVSYGVRA